MRDESQPGPRLEALLALGAPGRALEEAQALAGVERALFGKSRDPIRFARYVLLDRLGEGAAGVVFRAYDPELDRQVAIKLMQSASGGESQGRARLLREAQALARLNHPNVVSVFDVGSYAEDAWEGGLPSGARLEVPARGVFLVMELVKGLDLERWRERENPAGDEVLGIYLAAGRGLSAAHAAGLVHRDFKPTNVLLGEDGRVRVVDFGLVRRVDEGPDRPEPRGANADDQARSKASARGASPNAVATETGDVLGTPAYMAPEQHRGDAADARSDQFAFAVALFEALTGHRPFARQGPDLASAKAAGPDLNVDALAQLDSGTVSALRRAMQPSPEDRYDSMEQLLAALERVGRRRRRLLAATLGALAVVGLAGAVVALRGPSVAQQCAGEAGRAAQVWNPERAAAVAAAFEATGLSDAGGAFTAVDARMNDWARRWRDAAHERCEASFRVKDKARAANEVQARACLERRLREASTLATLWTKADVNLVRSAPLSVVELGRPEACTQGPARAVELDAAARLAVDEALGRLAEARALTLSGRYSEAMELVESVEAQAQAISRPALRAAVALARADVHERRGDLAGAEGQLFAAIWEAEAGHEDELAADAWLRLVWVVGVEGQRLAEGRRWGPFAEAALARVGHDPLRQATLDHNQAGLALIAGERDAALSGYRRALAVQREHLGEDHPVVARTLNHIGNVLLEQRKYEEALSYARRSQGIRERVLGAGHPLVAASLNNVAIAQLRQGELHAALDTATAALAITEGTGTPEERVAWHIRADVLGDLGREEASRVAKEQAQALDTRHARQRQ